MSERILPSEVTGRVVATIQEGHRFACYKLERENAPAFLKVVRDQALQPRIQREIEGNQAFAALIKERPAAGFRVPKLYGHGEDWLLTEWIEGEPLLREYTPEAMASSLEAVAAAHAFTDNFRPRPGQPTRFADIHKEITDKFAVRNIGRFFSEQIAVNALDFATSNLAHLIAARVHADLTPRHLLKGEYPSLTIVDFEGSRDDWPRFYEPVNYWTKIAILYDQPQSARAFVTEFFSRLHESMDTHDVALRVNAAVRILWHICELITKNGEPTDRLTPKRRQRIDSILYALPETPFAEIISRGNI